MSEHLLGHGLQTVLVHRVCELTRGLSAKFSILSPLPIPDWEIQLAGRNIETLDQFSFGVPDLHNERKFDAMIGSGFKLPETLQHIVYIVQRRIDGLFHSRPHLRRGVGRQCGHGFVTTMDDQVIAECISRIFLPINRGDAPFGKRTRMGIGIHGSADPSHDSLTRLSTRHVRICSSQSKRLYPAPNRVPTGSIHQSRRGCRAMNHGGFLADEEKMAVIG